MKIEDLANSGDEACIKWREKTNIVRFVKSQDFLMGFTLWKVEQGQMNRKRNSCQALKGTLKKAFKKNVSLLSIKKLNQTKKKN